MNSFVATPYRPIGLAAADQGLANLIHLLEWCTSLIGDAADGHLDLPAAAEADRALLADSATALHESRRSCRASRSSPDLEGLWRARLASAEHLQQIADEPAIAVRRADYAFHAQAIGISTAAAAERGDDRGTARDAR